MDVSTIAMPVKEAEKAYEEYVEVVKTRNETYLKDLKRVYHALKQGQKVIDILEAFKKTGVNKNIEPCLAISKSGMNQVYFHKERDGGGMFTDRRDTWSKELVADVRLPSETFALWETEKNSFDRNEIIKPILTTNVPIIPVHLLPKGDLNNYYTLWEVDEWRVTAATSDPYLLKRINYNTFVVLAEWDVTPVEKIVMRGV